MISINNYSEMYEVFMQALENIEIDDLITLNNIICDDLELSEHQKIYDISTINHDLRSLTPKEVLEMTGEAVNNYYNGCEYYRIAPLEFFAFEMGEDKFENIFGGENEAVEMVAKWVSLSNDNTITFRNMVKDLDMDVYMAIDNFSLDHYETIMQLLENDKATLKSINQQMTLLNGGIENAKNKLNELNKQRIEIFNRGLF